MHTLEYKYQLGTTVYVVQDRSVLKGTVLQLDAEIVERCIIPAPTYLIKADATCGSRTLYKKEYDIFNTMEEAWASIYS